MCSRRFAALRPIRARRQDSAGGGMLNKNPRMTREQAIISQSASQKSQSGRAMAESKSLLQPSYSFSEYLWLVSRQNFDFVANRMYHEKNRDRSFSPSDGFHVRFGCRSGCTALHQGAADGGCVQLERLLRRH